MRSDLPFTPTPQQIDAVHALEDAFGIKRGAFLKLLTQVTDWFSVIGTQRWVDLVASTLVAPYISPERRSSLDFDLPAKLDLLGDLAIISDGEHQRLLALDGFARTLKTIDGEFEYHLYFQDKQAREEFANNYASAWTRGSSTRSIQEALFSSGDHAVGKPRFTLMLLFAGLVAKMDEPVRAAAINVVEALLPPSLDRPSAG